MNNEELKEAAESYCKEQLIQRGTFDEMIAEKAFIAGATHQDKIAVDRTVGVLQARLAEWDEIDRHSTTIQDKHENLLCINEIKYLITQIQNLKK